MEECFKASYDLHHDILNADMEEEAQYATLLGHFVNYKFTVNAREAFHIHELRTAPAGHPGYRRIVNHMHELVAAVHPTIAAGMIFVNKDEDPALTRMASELATQQKLALLENS
jgi:thymidylate synthase ThyX